MFRFNESKMFRFHESKTLPEMKSDSSTGLARGSRSRSRLCVREELRKRLVKVAHSGLYLAQLERTTLAGNVHWERDGSPMGGERGEERATGCWHCTRLTRESVESWTLPSADRCSA